MEYVGVNTNEFNRYWNNIIIVAYKVYLAILIIREQNSKPRFLIIEYSVLYSGL